VFSPSLKYVDIYSAVNQINFRPCIFRFPHIYEKIKIFVFEFKYKFDCFHDGFSGEGLIIETTPMKDSDHPRMDSGYYMAMESGSVRDMITKLINQLPGNDYSN